MQIRYLAAVLVALGLTGSVLAGEVDKGAVIGGAIGGGAGAGVGSKVGGTSGAIIGGAIGGAAGAAIGSSATDEPKERVVVKERVIEKEVRVIEQPSGPPGHSRGKKKGWKKHHHVD
jgi:hypothetical protein